jgi:hypothetical protein
MPGPAAVRAQPGNLSCVAAYYQTILSLNFAILALLVGGLASIYQIATESGAVPIARLIGQTHGIRALIPVLTINLATAVAGSVLLSTPHDILPGFDMRSDEILGAPLTGLALAATSLLAGVLAAVVIAQAARVLSPVGATKALVAPWFAGHYPSAGRGVIVPAVADYARRALRDGRVREFGLIVQLLSRGLIASRALGSANEEEAVAEVTEHMLPLVKDAVLAGRFEQAADLTSRVTDFADNLHESGSLRSILRLLAVAADELIRVRAAGAICAVVDDIGRLGVAAVQLKYGEYLFNDACVTLGGIGERVPATFLHPSDPEVLLRPSDYIDPLGAINQTFSRLVAAAYPTGRAEPLINLLIWRDGLLRATQALVTRIDEAFRDSRLESRLVSLAGQFRDLCRDAALRDDWTTVYIVITALSLLAEDAEQPFYQEYPQDVAGWLIEAGMRVEEDEAEVPLLGTTLADVAADGVARSLPRQCRERCHYLLNAGIMSPVPWEARWRFVKRLGARLGTNFDMGFDSKTGADLSQ